MFNKVIVANRGAVAARILRALRTLGVKSVAVYSEADQDLPYLAHADESYLIGPANPRDSYLNQEALIKVLLTSGADGVHPGYGFLAENANFANRVIETGATFIGPSPQWIDAMGHKTRARTLMGSHGLKMVASSELLSGQLDEALHEAELIGYPVLVKPAAGGGGIGMMAAHDPAQLVKALECAISLSKRSFGSAEIYLERLITQPRHIEFQLLADREGNVRHLFERDCSIQRRHQKVIEESPAPNISRAILNTASDDIAAVMHKLKYDNIGTAETLFAGGSYFSFLEMNTRLQVEHAVTEEITGIDIVCAQIRLASGESLSTVLPEEISISGHAIEARIYAEDPVKFFPSPGLLNTLIFPRGDGIRVETGYAQGSLITPYYDPLIAKLIIHAPDRKLAINKLIAALDQTEIQGVKHNIPFIRMVVDSEEFRAGKIHTGLGTDLVARHSAKRQ